MEDSVEIVKRSQDAGVKTESPAHVLQWRKQRLHDRLRPQRPTRQGHDVADGHARQKKLGEASLESGEWDLAIAAYRTLVSLNTTDPARAHFDLATALFAAGKLQEAKRETIRSLEIAPSYREAQQLLLKL